MSRVNLDTAHLLASLGPYPALQPTAGTMSIAPLAADTSNKERFTSTGKEILVGFNSDASPHTVTVTSVAAGADSRTGDITAYSVPAGQFFFYEASAPDGWARRGTGTDDGCIYVEASDTTVKWAVFRRR